MDNNNNSCPSPDGMESSEKRVEHLSTSLRIFMDNLLERKKSIPLASIGQAIMKQVRPKALIVHPQLDLGIQMYSHFGSRFLTDSLNKHKFCASYNEVLKYKRCAIAHQGTQIPSVSESSSAEPTNFTHHVADNTDPNSRTLDGHNT